MRALIEPAELASYMRRPTLDNDVAAVVACELASGIVRDTIHQEITAVVDDEWSVSYPYGVVRGPWLLPELPVSDVSAVVVNGTALDPATDYVWTPSGEVMAIPYTRTWYTTWAATLPGVVRITYDHGTTEVPEGIRAVTLAVATRLYDNPAGDANRAVGSHNESYAVDLTLNEQRVLARYRA